MVDDVLSGVEVSFAVDERNAVWIFVISPVFFGVIVIVEGIFVFFVIVVVVVVVVFIAIVGVFGFVVVFVVKVVGGVVFLFVEGLV